MTTPDRIAVYWTAADEDTMPARLMAQTPRSPIFDEDLPKSQRIEYVRADLTRTTPLAEALAVVLEAMKDGEVWGRAVNAAMPIINADLNPIAWLPVTETRKALDAALRAIGEGKA